MSGAPKGSTASSIANAVAQQVGWFACVLGGAAGWGGAGASVALLLCVAHVLMSETPDREWRLLLAAGALGIVVDSLHAGFGILDFKGHEAGSLAPLWIVALWLQFGTALRFSFRWLSRRYGLASMLGLIGGPLAFLGGERLGAATFGEPRLLSLSVVAVSWALALPALVALADHLGGAGRYRVFKPLRRRQRVAPLESVGG